MLLFFCGGYHGSRSLGSSGDMEMGPFCGVASFGGLGDSFTRIVSFTVTIIILKCCNESATD